MAMQHLAQQAPRERSRTPRGRSCPSAPRQSQARVHEPPDRSDRLGPSGSHSTNTVPNGLSCNLHCRLEARCFTPKAPRPFRGSSGPQLLGSGESHLMLRRGPFTAAWTTLIPSSQAPAPSSCPTGLCTSGPHGILTLPQDSPSPAGLAPTGMEDSVPTPVPHCQHFPPLLRLLPCAHPLRNAFTSASSTLFRVQRDFGPASSLPFPPGGALVQAGQNQNGKCLQ